MSSHLTTWTPHRVDELKKHFEAGLSCSQIAGEIGVSRNAVIGKLSRLGLTRGRDGAVFPRQRRPRAEPRPARPDTRQGQVRILRALRKAMEAVVADEPVSDERRCSLFELGAQSCRWPIGRPGAEDFGFCGAAPVGGLPYCPYHARMAYRRSAAR